MFKNQLVSDTTCYEFTPFACFLDFKQTYCYEINRALSGLTPMMIHPQCDRATNLEETMSFK